MDVSLPIAASSPDPTQWAAIALGVITMVLVVFRPMRKKKKDPLQAPPPSSLAQQRAVEREMSNLLVEYEQMIRQMTAGVETRAARLELLIREADQKIALLRGLNGGAGPMPLSFEIPPADAHRLEAPARPASPQRLLEEEAASSPLNGRVYELADQGRDSREIAQQLGCSAAEVDFILALRGA